MTPHDYLRLRREASGRTLDDVAASIATEPRWPVHDRRAWLDRIERGVDPVPLSAVLALLDCFEFDVDVLLSLASAGAGFRGEHPRVCRICGCTEDDPRVDDHDGTCAWIAVDLCDAGACRESAAALIPLPGEAA